MTTERQHPRARDLESDLAEQLKFLARSADAFDDGDLAESKRIAVALRVLVHDTRQSRSLLGQLGIKEKMSWADSARPLDRRPNIVARSPGLTGMSAGPDGIIYVARTTDGIEQSSTTQYVAFDDWWTRPVILVDGDVEFSRRDLVLALANKDGGAHIDELNAKTHDLVHANSAGFIRVGGAQPQDVPTPIYASVRTVSEELLLSLRRSGRLVPRTAERAVLSAIDHFEAADGLDDAPTPFDAGRSDVSNTTFVFESFPHVEFEVSRAGAKQAADGSDGGYAEGFLQIVARNKSTGDIVHQSGSAGPTSGSRPPANQRAEAPPPPSDRITHFAFDNFPEAHFTAYRWDVNRVTRDSFGESRREAGWVDIYVTLGDKAWLVGGFAGPKDGGR